jgi:hypothetical protein
LHLTSEELLREPKLGGIPPQTTKRSSAGRSREAQSALLYQEEIAAGEESNFNKIVSRETAAESAKKTKSR